MEGTFSWAPAISGAFAATEASSFSSSALVLVVSAAISASCISSSSTFVFFAARSLSFAGCDAATSCASDGSSRTARNERMSRVSHGCDTRRR